MKKALLTAVLAVLAIGLIAPFVNANRFRGQIQSALDRPELLALPVTQQARDVIHAHRDRTRQVSVDDPGILTDIDNPEDYRVLQEQLAR